MSDGRVAVYIPIPTELARVDNEAFYVATGLMPTAAEKHNGDVAKYPINVRVTMPRKETYPASRYARVMVYPMDLAKVPNAVTWEALPHVDRAAFMNRERLLNERCEPCKVEWL